MIFCFLHIIHNHVRTPSNVQAELLEVDQCFTPDCCGHRGPANEWYDAMSHHLRHSKKVRTWFAQNVLFDHPGRFAEYLLECPSTEVRTSIILHLYRLENTDYIVYFSVCGSFT